MDEKLRSRLAGPPSGLWNAVPFIATLAVGIVMAIALKVIAR